MKNQPKPISISPELAARCDGPNQAENMDRLFRAVLSVPHSAVMKDTVQRAKKRANKKP